MATQQHAAAASAADDLLSVGPLQTLAQLEDWQHAPGAALGRSKVRFQLRATPATGPKASGAHAICAVPSFLSLPFLLLTRNAGLLPRFSRSFTATT